LVRQLKRVAIVGAIGKTSSVGFAALINMIGDAAKASAKPAKDNYSRVDAELILN